MPAEGGKGGEDCGSSGITNADFVASVVMPVPEGAFVAICSKSGDPTSGAWFAERASNVDAQCPGKNNNYVNCSSFFPGADGSFKARKASFAACRFVLLDDLGTKIPFDLLGGFEFTWLIETSPGNFQGGIVLSEPITDPDTATRLLEAIIAAGLCDKGATGPLTRWARLPTGINGKTKHAGPDGAPFRCRLVEWRPDRRYTPQQIVEQLRLELAPAGRPKPARAVQERDHGLGADYVFTPKTAENPVIAALKARGLYKTLLGSGWHDITCPMVHEHTEALDDGAAYAEPSPDFPLGGYKCHHSHGADLSIRQLLEFLGVSDVDARHLPVIRVVEGEIDRVVSAAEKVLADTGWYYNSGGLIASVATDPLTRDPSINTVNISMLMRVLSSVARWERFDRSSKTWVRCDPRHVNVLYESKPQLPPLAGLARQPFFRDLDGELVTMPGYDTTSRYFSVFDPREFVVPKSPTKDEARDALAMLEALLLEFPFAAAVDRVAALAAILTATARPSLPHAPAFHVTAPIFGSGKSYLCDLIAKFAGPAPSKKVSYPRHEEEAVKQMLALLLSAPSVITFDDMSHDWTAHGVTNRVLTEDPITERILGVSKTATVSTRVLILASGNNVGPLHDLRRRVLIIRLDPHDESPAMTKYSGSPVQAVRDNRGKYVAAALTIIQAWRHAGFPRDDLPSIATYGGEWADYCRYPLVWLGLPDPATRLLEQVRHSAEGDGLWALVIAWNQAFGSRTVAVREVISAAMEPANEALLDALCSLNLEERGAINPSKLGWVLKRNADRVIAGHALRRVDSPDRLRWRLESVNSAGPPASPDERDAGDGPAASPGVGGTDFEL